MTYRTAYLKANYPVEFMAAVLSYEVNSTDKLAGFVSECQRMGITILPPDVNKSSLKFAPECIEGSDVPNAIRYGLAAVKNVGEAAMAAAIAERTKNGPFTSLEDFCARVDSRMINKRLMEPLIKVGGFDWTGQDRAGMCFVLDEVLSNASSRQKERKAGMVSLFDDDTMGATKNTLAKSAGPPPWKKEELMAFEKELLGFFVSGHPLDNYRHIYESKYITRIADVQEVKEERVSLRVAGLIQRLEVKYTKKDNRAFATFALEDFSGTVEVISWSEGYEKFKDLLVEGGVIGMKGRCEKDSRSETIRMTVQEVKPLKPVKPEKPNGKPKPLALYMDVLKHGPKDLDAIHKILTDHPGETPVQLRIMTASGEEAVLRVGRSLNVEVNAQLQQALQPWVR